MDADQSNRDDDKCCERSDEPERQNHDTELGKLTFIYSLFLNALGFMMFAVGMREMFGGSCTAGLIPLAYTFPLAPIGLIVFIVEMLAMRKRGIVGKKMAVIGLLMSLFGPLFWYLLAGVIVTVFKLG